MGFGPWSYDWRELKRWKISESLLPPGSIVQFREPTIWALYRGQIMAIAVALLGQMLLITWLLYERRRRHRAEVATRQRATELAHMNRRAVAGQMSASIAHEVNQPLTAILSNAETLHDLLGRERLDLGKIREIVADIIAEDTRASEVILRKDESKSEIVDLNELVESTTHLLHGDLVRRKTSVRAAIFVAEARDLADQGRPAHALGVGIGTSQDEAPFRTPQADRGTSPATCYGRCGRWQSPPDIAIFTLSMATMPTSPLGSVCAVWKPPD